MSKDFTLIRTRRGIYERFQVEGLDALDADLKRMEKEMASQLGHVAITKAMAPTKDRVVSNLKTGAHSQNTKKKGGKDIVDTGALLESVRQRPKKLTSQNNRHKGYLYSDVLAGVQGKRGRYKRTGKRKPIYALQVEYGTENSAFGPLPEQPFMRPAFDGHERRMANELKHELKNTIVKWKRNKKD